MVYLQQDAFDKVDASTPEDRQKEAFELVRGLIQRDYPLKDKDEARTFFTQLTGLLKNLNYAAQGSPDYAKYLTQIDELVRTLGRPPAAGPEGEGDRQGPAAASAAAG
jgi:V/A-type H+/Na+-transporting ATPase subunit A